MKNAEGEDILVPEGQSKIWNYHPNLPVPNSPVFYWRPRIRFVLNWFRRGWLVLSGATIWVALAFVVFTWFQPSLAEWNLEGIISMLLRNLVLIFIVAGGLHCWLWAIRFQGDRLKFDIRDMMRDNGTFTFRNQVFDNMFCPLLGVCRFGLSMKLSIFALLTLACHLHFSLVITLSGLSFFSG